jgi:Ca-activated chloride channel family protein
MIQYILDQFVQLFVAITNALFGPVDDFRSPVLLVLMLVIPAYLFWYILFYAPRRLVVRLSYDPDKMGRKGPNFAWLRFLPMVAQLAALFLMVIALARPISSTESTEREGQGIDIMIALDASGSMETQDFPPFENRLEAAKQRAKEFVQGRTADRIGMVLFAEDAFSYLPLTMDYDLVDKQIDAIRTSMMPKEGTAMGTAIGLGVLRLRDSESRSKIMILLSDGASNRGQIDPITAANQAAKSKITIYPIAIGSEQYTISTPFGPQTINNSEAFDLATLEEIAKITGGTAFRAQNPEALGAIFTEIGEMEKSNIKSTVTREELDVYQRPLLWAGIFLLLSFVLGLTLLGNPLE